MKNIHGLVGGWVVLLALASVGCGGGTAGGGDAGLDARATADAAASPDGTAEGDAAESRPDAAATADAASADDAGPADAAAGRSCGTRGTGPCPTNQFCQHDIGADCGRSDAPGTCQTPPLTCPPEVLTVCGCDGVTYGNACEANMASVGVDHVGACPSSCDPRVSCRSLPPPCAAGLVPSVTADGSCWTGTCVPIDTCTCAEAAACPQPDTYTCHLSAGFCGPFV